MKIAQGKFFDKFERIFKLLSAFPRKSREHVGANGRLGKSCVKAGDKFAVIFGTIRAAHSRKDYGVCALQGDMEVAANPRRR